MMGAGVGDILRAWRLSERIVERIVDQVWLDAKARRLVAVDGQGEGRAAGLLVARDVAKFWQRLQLVEDLRRPLVQFVEISVLQGVLILRSRRATADIDVLRRLQKECSAFYLGERRPHPPDDFVVRNVALIARLHGDEE